MSKNQQVTLNCEKCGKEFKCSPSHAKFRKNCSLECSHIKGEINNTGRTHFKKGQIPFNKGRICISSQGYRIIGIDGRQYLEHLLIYLKHNKIHRIPFGFEIHHLNGIKTDNRPENLIMLDQSTHAKLHYSFRTMKGGKSEMINNL